MIITTITDTIGSTLIFKFTEKEYSIPKCSVIYAYIPKKNEKQQESKIV